MFDSQAMSWEDRCNSGLGKTLFAKPSLEDPETGVTVLFLNNKTFEIHYAQQAGR
ncbi:MAG TPA: hypothetical protein VHX18_05900 [Rhizomicrobium sp.]|nr:hypothetical protein [Rhizomicrobium sp.]